MSHVPVSSAEGESAEVSVATGGAYGKKGLGWALFEYARNPYYNVIVISVFSVYFAEQVVNDGSMGQTIVGLTIALAGMVMAIVAPILGSITDKGGSKKSFIFFTLFTLALSSALLGFITPELPGAVPLGMFLIVIGYCTYTVSELLHNAMLPGAGAPKALPMISSLGLALGNFAGVTVLMLYIAISTNGLLGLSESQTARLSGPAVALWLSLFIGFFFFLMPDVFRAGGSWLSAFTTAFKAENRTNPVSWISGKFREHPNVMRYLTGRMIYADGIAASLTIGAVYVAGHLGWTTEQTAILGIISFIAAIPGAFFGGFLDTTIGPKRALMLELSAIVCIGILQLSITQEALLFGLIPAGHEVWPGGVFPRLSDLAYALLIIPAAIFMVASISSSRYMLVHIAPPAKIGEFFGFYAMAGNVTVWIGPGLVALVTWLTDDRRLGFASVLLLLIIGLMIITTVRADKTPEHLKTSET